MTALLNRKVFVVLSNLTVSVFVVLAYWVIIRPIWGGSDEVGLVMMLDGKGAFSEPSSQALFVNIIFGLLTHLIPASPITNGFAVLIALSLLASSFVIFTLIRKRLGFATTFFIWIAIFLWPVNIFAFSTIAGVTTLAGVIALVEFFSVKNFYWGVAAFLLILDGFLIRDMQAIAVILVSGIFIYSSLRTNRKNIIFAIGIVVTLGFAKVVDYLSYQSPQWKNYNLFNPARVALTDYGASNLLISRSDILEANQLSQNDVQLLGNWFPLYPEKVGENQIIDAVSQLGPVAQATSKSQLLSNGFFSLFQPTLLGLVVLAVGITICIVKKKTLFTWLLFGLFVITISLLGRPGVFAFLYSPLLVVAIFPLLNQGYSRSVTKAIRVAGVSALIVSVVCISPLIAEKHKLKKEFIEAHLGLSIGNTVVWGDSIPFELVYPVFGRNIVGFDEQFISLGWANNAPSSNLQRLYLEDGSLTESLLSQEGLKIIARPETLNMLDKYCLETTGSSLKITELKRYSDLTVRRVWCKE